MQTTVSIDDALYDRAIKLLDPSIEKSDIFKEAIKVFVRVQSAKQLADMSETPPQCNPLINHLLNLKQTFIPSFLKPNGADRSQSMDQKEQAENQQVSAVQAFFSSPLSGQSS